MISYLFDEAESRRIQSYCRRNRIPRLLQRLQIDNNDDETDLWLLPKLFGAVKQPNTILLGLLVAGNIIGPR